MEETAGIPASGVTLGCARPITEAREVNGAEEMIGPGELRDGTILADFRPYQPRTFAIRLASPAPVSPIAPPVTQAVAVPYNLVGITPHGRPNQADFDGSGRTLPGELLPETITCQDVPFTTGPRGDGEPNILSCQGETILLPAGNFTRLYILASAVGGDRLAHFRVGEREADLSIQDAEEPIAQWDNRVAGEELITDPAQIQPGYTKGDRIAWVGTHRHRQDGGRDAYAYFYLYKYALDVPLGAPSITVPNDPRIRIAAMTVAKDPNAATRLATEMIDRPYATLVRITAPGPQFLDSIRVGLQSPIRDAVIRYTTDGSDPSAASAEYAGPFPITESTTIRARAFEPGMDDRFVASQTFTKLELRDAIAPAIMLRPGLDVRYYEGSWNKIPEYRREHPLKIDVIPTVKIPSLARPENFALLISGFIRIPTDGLYRFRLTSDDGSVLYIGTEKVIDNDGPHSETEKKGAVALRAGLHSLRLEYFNGVGDETLQLQVEGPGVPLGPAPATMLVH
jgi:alpha-mannosidase